MASLSSLLLLLLLAFSAPTQSQNPQLSRRTLALAGQELGDQPISKPNTKKMIDEQPISKPKKQNLVFESHNQTKIKPKKSKIPTSAKPVNPDPTPDPIWPDDAGADSDLIAEFRDLPTRIRQALIPDLKRISVTSKAYIHKAHKNMADNMKPFLGTKFAPKIATAASLAFLILPLFLVTALFYHLLPLLPLRRFLMVAQAYLAIYFLTLSLTALATGLEPLRLFHAAAPLFYAWTQAAQTVGYLMYLLAQLVHLVVAFSAGRNAALGVAQMVVGLAVGGHYYAAVFHRAVAGEAPRANWRVHGVYAGCFMVICLCARAERRKKAYGGGVDGKKS